MPRAPLLLLVAVAGCTNRVDFPGPDAAGAGADTGPGYAEDTATWSWDDTADTGEDAEAAWGEDDPVSTWPWGAVTSGALVSVGGPAVNTLQDLDSHGGWTAAVDGAAAWVSSDGGRTWTRSVPGAGSFSLGVAVTDDGIFVFQRYAGVYHSTDGGGSWTDVGLGTLSDTLATDGHELYAEDDSGALHRWTGSGWTACGALTSPDQVVVGDGVVYALSTWTAEVHASTDGCATWELRSSGSVGTVSQGVLDDLGVLIGHGPFDTTLRRSEDGGRTWTAVGALPADAGILTGAGGALYASVRQDGLWRSDDLGATWTRTGLDSGLEGWVQAMTVTDAGDLVVGTWGSAAWRSTDGGASWRASAEGMFGGGVLDATFDEDRLLLAAGTSRLWAWDGSTWAPTGEPVEANGQVTAVAARGEVVLVSSTWSGLLRSTDGGESWAVDNDGIEIYESSYGARPREVADLEFQGDVVLAAHGTSSEPAWDGSVLSTGGGVSRSADRGDTWRRVDEGIPAAGWDGFIGDYLSPATRVRAWADVVLVATTQTGVLRSTDRAETWGRAGGGLPSGAAVSDFARLDDTLWLSAQSWTGAAAAQGTWRSEDRGQTWTRASAGLPEEAGVAALAASADALFALVVGEADGVYRWEAAAEAWVLLAAAPDHVLAGPLLLHDDLLLVGTQSQGLLRLVPEEGS